MIFYTQISLLLPPQKNLLGPIFQKQRFSHTSQTKAPEGNNDHDDAVNKVEGKLKGVHLPKKGKDEDVQGNVGSANIREDEENR